MSHDGAWQGVACRVYYIYVLHGTAPPARQFAGGERGGREGGAWLVRRCSGLLRCLACSRRCGSGWLCHDGHACATCPWRKLREAFFFGARQQDRRPRFQVPVIQETNGMGCESSRAPGGRGGPEASAQQAWVGFYSGVKASGFLVKS